MTGTTFSKIKSILMAALIAIGVTVAVFGVLNIIDFKRFD